MIGFRNLVKTQLDPEEKQFKYHNGQLSALILYSEDDADLALFVRRQFDVIYRWTARMLNPFVIESVMGVGSDTIAYWHKHLSSAEYRAHSLLGWGRTKPINAAQLQDTADLLEVDKTQLPALIIFDDLFDQAKLVQPLRHPFEESLYTRFDKIDAALEHVDLSGLDGLLGTPNATAESPLQQLRKKW